MKCGCCRMPWPSRVDLDDHVAFMIRHDLAPLEVALQGLPDMPNYPDTQPTKEK